MIAIDELQKYQLELPKPKQMRFLTDQELYTLKGSNMIFDIELYPNYCLISFMSFEAYACTYFVKSDTQDFDYSRLRWIVDNFCLVGFNSRNFDIPILWASIQQKSLEVLNKIAKQIIIFQTASWKLEKDFNFKIHKCNHIDLQSVAPAAAQMPSLKHYGARMHVERLQDLPIEPMTILTNNQQQLILDYCFNDCEVTGWLFHYLRAPIKLREDMGMMYRTDLRSLSDAQISERIIATEIEHNTGIKPVVPKIDSGTIFRYQSPQYMRFFTKELQYLHQVIKETDFVVDDFGKVQVLQNGKTVSATNLWKIAINQTVYRLGIGGLHSSEQSTTHFSDSETLILDRDVASYYPAIILNQQLYPKHIGRAFLDTYKDIVKRRLQAKKAGDKSTANSLKICINGCFGKLGSRWSVFYSPDLLIQVTITGQLSLLMLVEMLEWSGCPVVSANTDGIVVKCPASRLNAYQTAVRDWEAITGFETEETRYASIHSRDVNNYIAITQEGEFKAKGAYTNELSFKDFEREALMTNPNGTIISEAVMKFLKTCRDPNPAQIEDTIKNCKDIRKFLFVRRVKGGAVKDQQYIGKIVRWYMKLGEFGAIKNDNANRAGIKAMVSDTTGGYPMMTLDRFPDDIDYGWYIRKANATLKDLGYLKSNLRQQALF